MPLFPALRLSFPANSHVSRTIRRISEGILVVVFSLFVSSCRQTSWNKTSPATASTEARNTNESAHALLFDLLGDESDVSKLRFIKREPTAVSQLTREIAAACGTAHKKLEAFGRQEPALNLRNLMLPRDEVETRKAIGKTKTKALLGKKGAEFEIELLLSQREAMVYGQHLALIAARSETNSQRKQFLASLSLELDHFQEKILDMLKAQYTSLKAKS